MVIFARGRAGVVVNVRRGVDLGVALKALAKEWMGGGRRRRKDILVGVWIRWKRGMDISKIGRIYDS